MAEEPIVNVPHPENFSWQPLHLLAFHGDMDGLARLESDAKRDGDAHATLGPRALDAPTGGWGGGKTALALAAERGQAAAVAWLLGRGADPTLVTPDGLSPLALAARGGHVAVLQALLAGGGGGGQGAASPNRRRRRRQQLGQADRWGRLPLMVAAAHGQASALACLLDAALEMAAEDVEDGARVLERAYCTGESGAEASTLLAHACRRGDAVTAATLLERGASPYSWDGGETVNSVACAALLEEWDRRYALAAARAAADAAQAAAKSKGSSHQRVPACHDDVLTAAVRGMDDDVFSAVVGFLGKSAKVVAAEKEEKEKETAAAEEDEAVMMEEEDDEEAVTAWDW